jgi:hypothetical protein
MTEDEEEAWVLERRAQVIAYLRGQGLEHGEVGEWTAWHLAPLFSIWAIESLKAPGWVGWWSICGNGPTDYCSADNCRHPRLAARRFVAQWRTALEAIKPDDEEIGDTGLPVVLAPLLTERADWLEEMAEDDEFWPR